MATVVVAPRARADLDRLASTLSLPDSTIERFEESVRHLGQFPHLGMSLAGRWSNYRYIIGPWRWMIVVYEYDEAEDRVGVVTVQDGRSSISAINSR